MAEKKRVEPEVSFPEPDGGEAGRPTEETSKAVGVNVHDLVPGLDGEIAQQEGADEIEREAARIAQLEAELAELRDKWTRALAEAENVRRRAERDRRDAEAYGGTRLARDMLSVWDNLERAMKAADDALRSQHGPFFEGVELTQRELLNAFAKHKIEKVTPQRGEKFDPNRHQAMFEVPVPGAEAGTVVETLQDGFVIADRLLRPALVGVAAQPPGGQDRPEQGSSEPEGDSRAGEGKAGVGEDGGAAH
jgi:molecular chaperone GrpE